MYREKYSFIAGITLIELMIGLFLSTLLLSLISVIYLTAVHNQSVQTALIHEEENSRIAIQILNADLRLAGFAGCAKLMNVPIVASPPYSFTPKNRVFFFIDKNQLSGTDGITVQHASIFFVNLLEAMSDDQSMQTTLQLSFKSGDVAEITDCQSSDIFVVKAVNKQGNTQFIQADHPLQKRYAKNAELHFLEKNSYFIAKTTRMDEANHTVNALYKMDIQQKKTELVEGIDLLQLTYTLLENGHYLEKSAETIVDWSKVIGISMSVIFSPMNNISLQEKGFSYVAIRE